MEFKKKRLQKLQKFAGDILSDGQIYKIVYENDVVSVTRAVKIADEVDTTIDELEKQYSIDKKIDDSFKTEDERFL